MRTDSLYADDLAYVHHVGYGDYVEGAAPGLLHWLRGAGIRTGTVVDLGCGSGRWLLFLSRAGYDALGIEQSPAFLQLARGHAPRARLVQDSAHTAALPPCRAVTAIGEVLAYQSPGSGAEWGLEGVFQRVASALVAGGLFVFDLFIAGPGEPYTFRSWRAGADWAIHSDSYEDRTASRVHRHITTFRRLGGGYRRSEEHHVLRVYEPFAVLRQLRAAGFAARTAPGYGAFAVPERRLVFVATKQ